MLVAVGAFVGPGFPAFAQTASKPASTSTATSEIAMDGAAEVVEMAGRVEISAAPSTVWRLAQFRDGLRAGDRIRTGPAGRATLQFSDRSVLRLDQNTLLEVRAPKAAPARRRFLLDVGRLLFLNREAPSDIEFETPLATGAIRGTEFVLAHGGGEGTQLALLEGAVALTGQGETLEVNRGEMVRMEAGRPAVRSPLVVAVGAVQWSLSYPGIVWPADLGLSEDERRVLQASLAAWQAGDVRGALSDYSGPEGRDEGSVAVRAYRAALGLANGDFEDAEARLKALPPEFGVGVALRELIAAVSGLPFERAVEPSTASEWLAHSYWLQSRSKLADALDAARRAVALAPEFGFAWVRVAEIEHRFEQRRRAEQALERALELAPRHPGAQTLKGFVALSGLRWNEAGQAFARALELDGAQGDAWMGRAQLKAVRGDAEGARRDFQVAAALEPHRSVFRSALGKAWSDTDNAAMAAKELRRATELDPGDPTPWWYSSLERHQNNEVPGAVRDLRRSLELNDRRSVLRPPLQLDRDRSMRGADLAAVYADAGLRETGEQAAARAVDEDFSNFSGHLFLARAIQYREDARRVDLRWETARQSELLLANLLAPPGAGNLSQQLSQQEHLRQFGQRPLGFSSFTEYRSGGDWVQEASLFGSVGGMSYALDGQLSFLNGDDWRGDRERTEVSFQVKQQVGPDDELYLQTGWMRAKGGDAGGGVAADPDLRVEERQDPRLVAGWHHRWNPGSHTLFLASRWTDDFELSDDGRAIPFLRQSGGTITGVDLDRARFDLRQDSEFALQSVELQQIWESEQHGIVAGARYQSGEVDTRVRMAGPLPPPFAVQDVSSDLERTDAYVEYRWRPLRNLEATLGMAYDRVEFPTQLDLPPVASAEDTRDLVAPRLGVRWSPAERTHLRAAYSESLGGLYFDDSIRLEPSFLAGFNQAPRSLIPESVVGLVPAARMRVAGFGVEQELEGDWFLGASVEWLRSDGERGVGAAGNSLPVPLPDTPTGTRETLESEERSLGVYAWKLLGQHFSAGVNYRLSEMEVASRFPEIPASATGLDALESDRFARLQHLSGTLLYQHPGGWFGEWQSSWYHQEREVTAGDASTVGFWQHDVFGGYRFPRRRAEVRMGIRNINDAGERLDPIQGGLEVPRARTFVVSLRLNF